MQQAQQGSPAVAFSGGRAAARGIFPVFPGETYRDGFIQALLGARQEYLALLAQAQRMKEEREKLANHIGEIQKTLREFLRPYYPEALPEDLRAGVQTLSKELSEWKTLQRRKEQLEEQNAGNLALSQALTGSIRAALSRYQALDETRTLRECTQALLPPVCAVYALQRARRAVFCRQQAGTGTKRGGAGGIGCLFAAFPAMQGDAGEKLEALERDAGAWALASGQLLSAQQALTTFDREHPAVESMDEEQTLPDPEELQRQEAQAQQKLDALEENGARCGRSGRPYRAKRRIFLSGRTGLRRFATSGRAFRNPARLPTGRWSF